MPCHLPCMALWTHHEPRSVFRTLSHCSLISATIHEILPSLREMLSSVHLLAQVDGEINGHLHTFAIHLPATVNRH